MTAPIAVRDVAAAAGLLLVLGTVISVVTTVIVPRKSGSRLTRLVASAVNGVFGLIVRPVASYRWATGSWRPGSRSSSWLGEPAVCGLRPKPAAPPATTSRDSASWLGWNCPDVRALETTMNFFEDAGP